MWTVCWTEEPREGKDYYEDRWARIDGRDAMDIFISELVNRGISVYDILVFPPDSEHDITDRG